MKMLLFGFWVLVFFSLCYLLGRLMAMIATGILVTISDIIESLSKRG